MVFTNNGLNNLRNYLAQSGSYSPPAFVQFGTDTTSATQSDSAIGSQAAFKSFESIEVTDKQVKYEGLLLSTEGTGSDIAEFGLSSLATAGTLHSREVFTPIAKTTGSEMQIFITVRLLGINDG